MTKMNWKNHYTKPKVGDRFKMILTCAQSKLNDCHWIGECGGGNRVGEIGTVYELRGDKICVKFQGGRCGYSKDQLEKVS